MALSSYQVIQFMTHLFSQYLVEDQKIAVSIKQVIVQLYCDIWYKMTQGKFYFYIDSLMCCQVH